MTGHLSDEALAELRARLLAEQRRLVATATGRLAETGDEAWTPDRGDPQDRAAAERVRQALLRLSARDAELLREVEAALARMEDGTYGVCEETGEPIPLARLRAIPWARRTAEAEELAERERRADPTAPDPIEGY
ncbi:MAG: TraR/DksA family transcriptional regulator [Deltaproteobacteria bacterium]|nr:MAG: TraR/DksA family transcriptional regulator [Deltaproteobacteria bacterium]